MRRGSIAGKEKDRTAYTIGREDEIRFLNNERERERYKHKKQQIGAPCTHTHTYTKTGLDVGWGD